MSPPRIATCSVFAGAGTAFFLTFEQKSMVLLSDRVYGALESVGI